MIPLTYMVKVDLNFPGPAGEFLLETGIGTTFSAVVNDIISGQFDRSFLMRVYKLDGERVDDVSVEACAEILKYAATGGSIGRSAEQFLNYHGFDIPNREAA